MPRDTQSFIDLTADIVAAHVGNNKVAVDSVPAIIQNVFAAIQGLGRSVDAVAEKPTGAVSVRASVKPGHILSMIDGKPYKMLKRHLSLNGYTPESYREAFNLPKDYPMVAAEYAARRRSLALEIGLGRKAKVEAKAVRKPRAAKAAPVKAGA